MNFKQLMLAAPLLALVSGSVSAQAPNSGQAAPAAAKEKDRVICKFQEMTGSRINTFRICKTRTEWEADEQDAKRLAGEWKDGRTGIVQNDRSELNARAPSPGGPPR
jgi:hypothetical protein